MTDDSQREVFIKNIPYEINDDDLSAWCSSFGPIKKCVLKRDRFGKSRGFAFVTFETIEGHNNICKNKSLDILSKIIFTIENDDILPSSSYFSLFRKGKVNLRRGCALPLDKRLFCLLL